ncbi:hypothetical protein [Hyphomicrobium sp.]|uniref:hypothetical protein n=1 Tax=Hyphomicrobium sp. TaxID=82 RepID=UPI001DC8097F|nr:hypothetical protein [Hyphomicrobium sp.]MBY0560001.1 hypothetical protein [Hyphomicrobium sp.]
MPTIELKKHRRLNVGGQIYEKGRELEVDDDTAELFSHDDRFKVSGYGDETPKPVRVPPKSMNVKIREAADSLDVDVEKNFTDYGSPSADAISEVLRQKVVQADVDRALGIKAPKAPAKVEEKKTDEKKVEEKKPGVVIKHKKAEEPKPAETLTNGVPGVQASAGADVKDPTTEGAMEA